MISLVGFYFIIFLFFFLNLHKVATMSLQYRCNVVTLQQCFNDVPATLCVCWVSVITTNILYICTYDHHHHRFLINMQVLITY